MPPIFDWWFLTIKKGETMKLYLIPIIAAVIIIAGCSQYSNQGTALQQPSGASVTKPDTAMPQTQQQEQPTYLTSMQAPSLWEILVDDNGMALYTFAKDVTAGASACYGMCATNWPPLMVSGSVMSRKSISGTFGAITRTDGTKQATYNDKPLYYYIGDKTSGQTTGNGFGGMWSVVVISLSAQPQPYP